MGKLKTRQKLHISSNKKEVLQNERSNTNDATPFFPVTSPNGELFAGLHIGFENIKNSLSDVQSIKSYKSINLPVSSRKTLPKKEKIKMRRKLLLQKIDSVKQIKKELKVRKKRKNNAVIGDTNIPLHGALPSLESLLKNRASIKCISAQSTINKGIMKASQRKKKFVYNLNIFKRTLNNLTFKENPFKAIAHHIKCSVEQEHTHSLINRYKK